MRGRGEGPQAQGSPTHPMGLPAIPVDEQEKVLEDDLLWVRTVALTAAARWWLENRFPGLGARLGYWATSQHESFFVVGASKVKLDQGPLGLLS